MLAGPFESWSRSRCAKKAKLLQTRIDSMLVLGKTGIFGRILSRIITGFQRDSLSCPLWERKRDIVNDLERQKSSIVLWVFGSPWIWPYQVLQLMIASIFQAVDKSKGTLARWYSSTAMRGRAKFIVEHTLSSAFRWLNWTSILFS